MYVMYQPQAYSFAVRPGAERVIVTCTLFGFGGVTVQLRSPTKTYNEADLKIYENTIIGVAPTLTYQYVKKATATITPPTAMETWTLLLTLSTAVPYQVGIEVY